MPASLGLSELRLAKSGLLLKFFRVPMNHVVYVTPFSGWMRKLYVRLARRMPSTSTPLEA